MADIKITNLTAGTVKLTDVYPAVDITDPTQAPSGTTKKYTIAQLIQFSNVLPQATYLTSGSGTYTTPVGAFYLEIEMVGGAGYGGGGGGGGGLNGSSTSGGGGGGGGYLSKTITSPSATYSYSVGIGGSGGTAGASSGIGASGTGGFISIKAYFQ